MFKPAPSAEHRPLTTLAQWFDTQAVESGDDVDAERIDWLRVIPFIGMHLACLGVIWVGFSWVALAVAVATWGGGFDVLYALQDVSFDRSQRLYSLPVAFGERRALAIARGLHLVTVVCLAAVGAATFAGTHRGSFYALGWVIAAGLLV